MKLKGQSKSYASPSNAGVILIEMLMSVMVIGCIIILMLNMINAISYIGSADEKIIRASRLGAIINSDLNDALTVDVTNQCLQIPQNERLVTYCDDGHDLIREVDGKGYERIISDVDGQFIMGEYIYYRFEIADRNVTIPIWKVND